MKMESFQTVFSRMMEDRIELGCYILETQDKKHQELDRNISSLINKLINLLGEGNSHLVYALEESVNNRDTVMFQHVYKQGLRDGIKLNLELDLITSGGVADELPRTC